MFVKLEVKMWFVSICLGILLLFFSNPVISQCTPVINYTTTTGTLKGCSPFNVSFTDPNNSFARTWDFGDSSPTSGSKTPFHTFKQGVLGDTTYVVSLFKACGVGATTKVTVTVYAVPKVDFTIDTNQVCAIYDFVHFKRVSDPGTCTWDFGDNTSSTNSNPKHAYGSGGVYDVSLKVKNSNGCEVTKIYSELITVNSLPSPDFILDNYSGCAPFDVQITNKTDTSAVKIKYWSWDYDNGDPLDSLANPGVITFDVPGTKQMALTTTSDLGCKSTTYINLSVISTPTADFTITPTTICSSDSVQIKYIGSAGASAQYNWDFNGGTGKPGVGKGPHWVKWEKGGIKSLNLSVLDSTCTGTFADKIPVLISPTITFKAEPDTICTGDLVVFSTLPGSLANYSLYKNGSLLLSSTDNSYSSETINDGDSFYMIAKDVQGCSSKKSQIEKIKVKTKPNVSLLSSDIDNIICAEDLVTFTSVPNTYELYTFFSYSKSLQTGVVPVLNINTLEDNDSVFVEATNLNGCSKTSSNAFVMKVLPKLDKPFVNCKSSTISSILFEWDSIIGSSGYEVSVNGGAFQTPSAGNLGLTHLTSGLNGSDSVKLTVRALGYFSCGSSLVSEEKTCYAKDCGAIDVDFIGNHKICKGESVLLRLDNISTAKYSVSWNGGAFGRDTTYLASPSSDNVIIAEILDSSQVGSCPSYLANFKIDVLPTPTVNLNSSLFTTSCEGDLANLVASPSGYDEYIFYNGNEIVQKSWKNKVSINSIKNNIPLKVVAKDKGCIASSNLIINTVIDPMEQPVVNCGTSTTSSMEFKWDAVNGALGYEVSVDGGNWITPSTGSIGLKHVLNGLIPGSASYLTVRVLGATVCGNSPISLQASCFTSPCTGITFNAPPPLSVCKGSSANISINGVSINNPRISWNTINYSKNTSFTVTPTKDTTITIIVKNGDELNCPFVTKYANVNVLEQPDVSLSIYPTLNCLGDSISMIASPVNYENYKFYNGASLLYSGYLSTFKTSKLKTGAQLKVVARNGSCVDTSNLIILTMDKPLETPVVNSGAITSSSIEFVWDTIPGAIGYMVSVNDGPYITPSSGNLGYSHLITGLSVNDSRSLKVIALGNSACGNSSESAKILRYTTDIDSVCTAITFYKAPHTAICEGDSVKVFIANLNAINYQVSWKNEPRTQSLTYECSPVKTDTVKVQVYRPNEPLCPAVTKYIRVNVNPKPVISLFSSISNDSICENNSVQFTALPNGYATYSFRNASTILQTSNGNEYSVPHLKQSLMLEVDVKDEIGCTSTSSILPMNVVPLPIISLTSNAVNNGICKEATMNVIASPSGYKKYVFIDNGLQVQSTSSTAFNAINVQKKHTVSSFAIDAFGCIGDTSNILNLSLFELPVVDLVSSDADNNICDGDSLTVSVTPSDLVEYTFKEGSTVIQTGNKSEYKYLSLSASKTLYVIAKDSNNCNSKITDSIKVIVNPIPLMLNLSAAPICSGTSLIIPLTSSTPSSFNWSAVDNPNVLGESLNNKTLTSIKDTLFNQSIVQENVKYTIQPISLKGCFGDIVNLDIKLNPSPKIFDVNDTLCSGELYSFSPINGFPSSSTIVPLNSTYTWPAPVLSIPGTISGQSAQITPVASLVQTLNNNTNANTSLVYTITPKSGETGACIGSTFKLRVTINPTPSISSYSVDTICSESSFTVAPSNGSPNSSTIVPSNTQYTWPTPITLPNGSIVGATQEVIGQSSISQKLTNTTLNFGTITYTITPAAGSCVGNSFSVPIVVKPTPTFVNPLTAQLCSGLSTLSDLKSSIPSKITWSAKPNSSVSGETTTLQTTTKITDILINSTNIPQIISYQLFAISNDGCQNKDTTLRIQVNPVPDIKDVALSICHEDSLKYSPSNGGGSIVPLSTQYSWSLPISIPTDTVYGGTAQSSYVLSVKQKLFTRFSTGEIDYIVSPISGDAGACKGQDFTIKVTVHPVPNPTLSVTKSGICRGESVVVTANLDETFYPNTTYLWNTNQHTKQITQIPLLTTTYKLNATSNGCTSKTDSLIVSVDQNVPVANAGLDSTICRYDTISLNASGGKSYLWLNLGKDSTLFNPKVAPIVTTKYKVNVYNDFCFTSDEVTITIDKCLTKLPNPIPQIITPNGDDANDFWNIIDIDYFPKNSLLIFNRWGQVVYEAAPYANEWVGQNKNGDTLPDGTYYIVLNLGNGQEPYKGYVVVTR